VFYPRSISRSRQPHGCQTVRGAGSAGAMSGHLQPTVEIGEQHERQWLEESQGLFEVGCWVTDPRPASGHTARNEGMPTCHRPSTPALPHIYALTHTRLYAQA